MRIWHYQRYFSKHNIVLIIDYACGQPILEPPSLHVCPNDSVVFTCHDKQIIYLQWVAEPYIPHGSPIGCVSNQIELNVTLPKKCSTTGSADAYLVLLTNISNRSEDYSLADMTVNLTLDNIFPSGSQKITTVICRTKSANTFANTSANLTFAGNYLQKKLCYQYVIMFIILDVPYWKNSSITYHQENETYFTAVLQLGDMFDGGGVPIDHYIIQVDNNTQLETTDLTYSVDVMYNDTLFVNISAHNCAGYSDIISLTPEYNPGRESVYTKSLI